jgi:TRAP-type C4-dicarboxylate transport system permease small subunit
MNKLKEIWSYSVGTFMVVNIAMILLQGGSRYNHNSSISFKLCLFVSVPLTIVVAIIIGIEEFKKK